MRDRSRRSRPRSSDARAAPSRRARRTPGGRSSDDAGLAADRRAGWRAGGSTCVTPAPGCRARFGPSIDGTASMSVVFRESTERALLSSLDVGLLSVRDRACLRLLYRTGVATADQLATLIFPSRRTALRRLRRLWQLGLLERAPLAPERGGIPVAYRITRRGSKRLGYHDTRTGEVSRVRHTLHIVDAVRALVRSAPD